MRFVTWIFVKLCQFHDQISEFYRRLAIGLRAIRAYRKALKDPSVKNLERAVELLERSYDRIRSLGATHESLHVFTLLNHVQRKLIHARIREWERASV